MRWSYGYGSIPINTIFRGMNIHLPAILMFTRGARFWPIPIWLYGFLEHFGTQNPNHGPPRYRTCAVLWSHRIQATSGDPCFGTIWKLWEIPDMLGTLKKTSKLGRTWTQIKALLKLLRWTWRRKVGQKLYPVGDLASRTWQKGSVLICACSRCIFMLENDWTNAEKTQAKSVLEVPRAI